jgi:8-oxo-dGTP pyrophosphatase MutT (NUDIX family)
MANFLMNNQQAIEIRTLAQAELTPLAQLIRDHEISHSTEEVRRDIFLTDTIESTFAQTWIRQRSGWEMHLGAELVQTARHQFIDTVARLLLPPDVIKNYCARWEEADFTSVGGSYLCIDNAWSCCPGHGLDMKKEIDLDIDYSRVGREDISMLDLQSYQWGGDRKFTTMVAVRGKIPGTRYVKSGTQFVGDKIIDVPADFPVTCAEKFGEKFFIITPHTLPGFTYGEHQFVRHPFSSVDNFVPETWHEGIMVLMGDGRELRSKYAPTIDVRMGEEVWECIHREGLRKLRPRFGKWPQSPSLIFSMVTPDAVLARPRQHAVRVSEVVAGDVVPHLALRSGTMMLDSGYRMDVGKGYPVTQQKLVEIGADPMDKMIDHVKHLDVRATRKYRTNMNRGKMKEQIIGSKILVVSHCGKYFYLIKESANTKPWDFLGGKLEDGETPIQAAIREAEEEAGLQINVKELYPLGHSDAEDEKFTYRSYLFMYVWTLPREKWVREMNFREPDMIGEGCVSWYARLMAHIFRTYTPEGLFDLYLYANQRSDGLASDVHSAAFKNKYITLEETNKLVRYKRKMKTPAAVEAYMMSIGFTLDRVGSQSIYKYRPGTSNMETFGWGIGDVATFLGRELKGVRVVDRGGNMMEEYYDD